MNQQQVTLNNGVKLYNFASADELIDFAEQERKVLVAVNAEKIIHATEQTKSIMERNIAYADGAGAVLALRKRGFDARKFAGCELWLKIVERLAPKGRSFYLVGGRQEVIDDTVAKLRQNYPGINIVGYRNGYIRSDDERQALIDDVAEKRLDVVFVAMGSPKQEMLMGDMQLRHGAIIEYIQGYPSIVYEFALYCAEHEEDFRNSGLMRSLKGVFLNSEYPQPIFREKIEQLFNVRTIANYGHTEAVCLGFDYGDGRYEVMQSYGYSEDVQMDDGIHMVGITYDNIASPLIRYDTNDIMDEVVIHDNILVSFTMTRGSRNGQFVVDCKGRRITVSGLLCGKLRNMLDYCSHVQMSQMKAGLTTVYYVPLKHGQSDFEPKAMFDADDIEMDFVFKQIPEPIRTKAGKVLLLVKEPND